MWPASPFKEGPQARAVLNLIEEVFPLLPNPCHFQNYDQSMSQLNSASERCSPRMCADEVSDEDEGRSFKLVGHAVCLTSKNGWLFLSTVRLTIRR